MERAQFEQPYGSGPNLVFLSDPDPFLGNHNYFDFHIKRKYLSADLISVPDPGCFCGSDPDLQR